MIHGCIGTHGSFICVTWHIHMCDMTLPHVWQDSFVCVTWHILCVTWIVRMGWLRLVGSLKLQVSFAKEPCKRDYILQKRPIILRSLLIVATSYAWRDSRRKRAVKNCSDIWMCQCISHMNGSCYTCERVMSFMNESFRITNESWVYTYEWVMSHIWIGRVPHGNGSCHTWIGDVAHLMESCCTYECVLSHTSMNSPLQQGTCNPVWMSHVTHTHQSCSTYESVMSHIWVMSHVWMSHVTHTHQSCPTYESAMSHRRCRTSWHIYTYHVHINES